MWQKLTHQSPHENFRNVEFQSPEFIGTGGMPGCHDSPEVIIVNAIVVTRLTDRSLINEGRSRLAASTALELFQGVSIDKLD
jgi:hypothetical protein